jgi:sulfonate transport system substrate-binding protein
MRKNRESKIRNHKLKKWYVSLFLSIVLFTATEGFTGIGGPITIGVEQSPLLALMMIAEDQGFFSQQGVNVKVKYYASGKLALDGMFAKEVELATPAETPIVFSSFERIHFSIIATIGFSDNDPKIVARKDRGIQKPGDLRGKRIATQKASAVHFFLHSFLIINGLSEKNVTLSFKHPDELVPALAKGEIDAFSMREPYISRAKTLLRENIILFEKPGLHLKTYNLVGFNTFIKDRPQAVKSVLKALIKSEELAKKYPKHAQRIVSNKTGLKESEIAGIWPDLRFEVALEQSLLTSLENEARWVIRNKLTDGKKVPNYLNFIYLDTLEAVKPRGVTIIR